MIAFGWIVWKSAPPNRALRIVGALLLAHAVFGRSGRPCISVRCWPLAAAR